jgi:hypothetical protein
MRYVFDPSSKESAGETGFLSYQESSAAPPKRPSKRGPHNEHRAWICKTLLDRYLFYDKSTDQLLIEEKTNSQLEHLLTLLQHDLSRAVLACKVLVDSSPC